MIGVLVAVVLSAVPLPPECGAPELRDVSALKALAQRSGSLSAGLDSVATWCFDSGGTWTAGQKPKGKKKELEPDAAPQGECLKAVRSCEAARELAPDTTLMYAALEDLKRPFLGRRYTPKRSGLEERPSEAADCGARARSELFTQAQARMDLARLAALTQNEYASYKQWLLTEGLRCAQAVRAGRVDPLRKGIGIDAPVSPDRGKQTIPRNASGTPPIPGVGEPEAELAAGDAANAGGPTEPGPGGRPGAGGGVGPSAGAGGAGSSAGAGGATSSAGGASSAAGAGGARSSAGGGAANASAGAGGPGSSAGAGGTSSAAGAGATNSSAGAGGAGSSASARGGAPSAGALGSGSSGASAGGGLGVGRTPPPIGDGSTLTGGGTAPGGAGTSGLVVPPVATPTALAAASVEPSTPSTASLVEKWRAFAEQQARLELDRDYTLGFLGSRELRECRCPRLNPAGIAASLRADAGVAQLAAEDPFNSRCEQCLLDAYGPWRARADKQCKLMEQLSDYELGVLERSDDGSGLPPRCFEGVRAKRGAGPLPPAGAAGRPTAAGTPTAQGPPGAPARPTTPGAPVTPGTSAAGAAVAPVPSPATGRTVSLTTPAASPVAVTSPIADSFVRSQDYAPVPTREDGRLYVRIFTSSACVAEVLPGPLQARTGDLLLIPLGAKQLSVRSPCGGLAEVYWGREERPRVSEIFGRNQPLQLQFRAQ